MAATVGSHADHFGPHGGRDCGRARHVGPAAPAALAAPDPPRLVGPRAGRPARGHHPHGAARRRPAAPARLPGRRRARRGRRVPARFRHEPARRCCSTTTRPPRSPSPSARRPAARCGAWRSPPSRPSPSSTASCRPGSASASPTCAPATVGMAGPADAIDAGLLVTLSQACAGQERIRMSYVDREGTPSDRRVEPYRLVEHRPPLVPRRPRRGPRRLADLPGGPGGGRRADRAPLPLRRPSRRGRAREPGHRRRAVPLHGPRAGATRRVGRGARAGAADRRVWSRTTPTARSSRRAPTTSTTSPAT